ncbi:unnamed protein product [Phyllotreta striolata]|uniref:tRNA-splicing endonuclease subunit Sen2 n=1 Tax=Phyllotreta striolata TaxID=444603 RepID=A0A9N9TIR9_PHYSR|nr:unnamed protein product [Phyllotreta striolata]
MADRMDSPTPPKSKSKRFFRNFELVSTFPRKIPAFFDGFTVRVDDKMAVYRAGCFGKGSLSRSLPTSFDAILRKRQFEARRKWRRIKKPDEKTKESRCIRKIVVISDSDDDNDLSNVNDMSNVNDDVSISILSPEYHLDESGSREALCLGLEEAFFLKHHLDVIDVTAVNGDDVSECDRLWSAFSATDSRFVGNYVSYVHFRSKNWIVKPGIKFGGDFLLYKEGPAHFHASYVVIVETLDESLGRVETGRSMDNLSLACLNRSCESTGKELLICQVTLPKSVDYKDLSNVVVKEIVVKRCEHV